MKRLLACAGIALALSIVSVKAQAIPAADIVTLAPEHDAKNEGCPSSHWTPLNEIINPNASRSSFVIPAGSVFVLTGATVARGIAADPGLGIGIQNVVTHDFELVAIVPVQNLAGSYGAGGLMFIPGVVVGHDTAICANRHTDVRVYGYFEKSKKLKADGPVVIGR